MDKAQIYLECFELSDQLFPIHRLSLSNDKLSESYRAELTLYLPHCYEANAWLNKKVRLMIDIDQKATSYCGFINKLKINKIGLETYQYRFQLVPMLELLREKVQTRAFVDQSIENTITDIIQPYGIPFLFSLEHKHDVIPFLLQYKESDLDFLKRLVAQHDLLFSFREEVLIFGDSLYGLSSEFSEKKLSVRVASGLLGSEPCVFNIIDSNDIVIETNYRDLRPGQVCQLNKQGYYIVAIEHFVESPHASYYNKVLLELVDSNKEITSDHEVHFKSVGLAQIEGVDSSVAFLDEQGRYRIRLLKDSNETQKTQASVSVVAAQHSAGMHFPLKDKTQVLMGCIEGDAANLFVLGVLPEISCPSPVSSENPLEHAVRTSADHCLMMSDHPDNLSINLSTKEEQNQLKFVNADEETALNLKSKSGGLHIYAEQNVSIQTDNSHYIGVDKDYSMTLGKDQFLTTVRDGILYQSQGNINLQSNAAFRMSATDVFYKSEAGIQLEGQAQQSWRINEGRAEIRVEDSILFQSRADCEMQSDRDIVLLSKRGANIAMDASGDLRLSAKTIRIKADQIIVEGDASFNGG